jgi:endoglucanase
VNVPNTGGYQNWQTVSASVSLAAGTQSLRVYATSNGWNLNWIEFAQGTTATSGTGSSSGTVHVEAENWNNMSGVATENTTDVGGGKDVGWIDNGDWMDYNVSVSGAGTYTINLRLATPYTGSQLQIKDASGGVLATVNVPTTGGFQNWQTVSASIGLQAGSQTIRIQSTASAGFNINWLEIVAGSSATLTAQSTTTAEVLSSATSSLQVYPNPVASTFQLQITNDLTGAVNVQVYDMQGRVAKQFALTKTDAGSSQFYLSIGELPSADYIIKATMNGWTESKQIVKQ